MPTQADIGTAVLARMARQFSVDSDVAEVDRSASLLTNGQFALGGYELHSLELVEAITMLEEELAAPLLEEDLEQLDTIDKLADVIARTGSPERIEAFCDRWIPVTR